MPEPIEAKTDPFGMELPAPEVKQEEDIVEGEDEGEGKKDEPSVSELSKKIGELEALHGTKDENIKAMREKIKSLEKGGKSEGNEGAKEGEDKGETMFAEVKFSKDLTQDERDEMTDTEIKLFDETATLKQGMNKMFEALKAGQGAGAPTDLNTTARMEAMALAGGDKDMANQIIEQFNEFNNEGLDADQIKERIAKASKLVPDFTPAKEQEHKQGSAVKKKGGADAFGTDAIIKEARSVSTGRYSL